MIPRGESPPVRLVGPAFLRYYFPAAHVYVICEPLSHYYQTHPQKTFLELPAVCRAGPHVY